MNTSFVYVLFLGSSGDIRAEVGLEVSLPCRVDTAQCGELHSVKWYRDNQRVYVFSHEGDIRRPEGDGSDRLVVHVTSKPYTHLRPRYWRCQSLVVARCYLVITCEQKVVRKKE